MRLRAHGVSEQVEIKMLPLAYRHGAWMIHPDPIDESSVIYSFGVGSNIAWDLAMIERFGCAIDAFDPTPRSIEWIRAQQSRGELPERFVFHEYGVGDHDGITTFYPPRRPQSSNYSSIDRGRGFRGAERIKAQVYRLESIMQMLGHSAIDILKMDIEGGEYAVIEDLLQSDIKVGQILVEFHHNFRSVSFARTVNAVRDLNQRGYRVFHLSKRSYEMSLINGVLGAKEPIASQRSVPQRTGQTARD